MSLYRLTDAKRRQFISNGCHLLGVIFYCRDRDLSNKMQIANKPSTGQFIILFLINLLPVCVKATYYL
ncbi:hypothetical protein BDA96_10G178400 [Sorghum bicolor]|uniref:Uncharacterized protein n=1 Tax=Sorghum bicolor TaxID=4558 RepID=A0A921Q2C9_SORBI|nr:hypothetical protein BDA96_10G178400 [Sorghum bicolor]